MCYMIYFDNAATSFYKPKMVKDAVNKALNFYTANPGRSGHRPAQEVAMRCFETREVTKEFFNADRYNLIFTKNCTEALNLAIFGCLEEGDHVITTIYEHNSVLRPLYHLKENKIIELTIIDSKVEDLPEEIEKSIITNTKLIVTTHSSNVTGEIVDIKKISHICKKYNILYLIDGAQSSGHMKVNLSDIDADMFAFAGHKGLLSTTGVGGLLIKSDMELKPMIFGGTGTDSESLVQPKDFPEGYESGTIATLPIISLYAGITYLEKNLDIIIRRENELSKYAYEELSKLNFLDKYFNKNSKNVFSFNIKNIDSSTVSNILDDQFNICTRPGLHCAPFIHQHFKTTETGAVRVSLDYNNNFAEIDKLVYALKRINMELNG